MNRPGGPRFELLLFSSDVPLVRAAVAAGVDAVIVDWERQGKPERQRGADTQIGADTLEDLERVRAATAATVICRVNACEAGGLEEIDAAIGAGAEEVLLPMVRSVRAVEAALERARGRAGVGVLVETREAVELAPRLGALPLRRAYVGLNDLRIDRSSLHIFSAVEDGTVERVAASFGAPFGFAGLTLPDRGSPVPCRLLIGEMTRLGCSFSFLRRSFLADVRGRDLAAEVDRLRLAIEAARRRAADEVARDAAELRGCLARLSAGPTAAP